MHYNAPEKESTRVNSSQSMPKLRSIFYLPTMSLGNMWLQLHGSQYTVKPPQKTTSSTKICMWPICKRIVCAVVLFIKTASHSDWWPPFLNRFLLDRMYPHVQQRWAEDRREREEGKRLLSFGSLLLLPHSQRYCIPWLNAAHGSKVPLTGGKKRGSCQALTLYASSFPAPVHPLTECSAGEQCAIYWRMGAREGKLPSSGSSRHQFLCLLTAMDTLELRKHNYFLPETAPHLSTGCWAAIPDIIHGQVGRCLW